MATQKTPASAEDKVVTKDDDQKEELKYYKLLAPSHSESLERRNEDGTLIKDANGFPIIDQKTFKQGDVIETVKDLEALWNAPNDKRFQKVEKPKVKAEKK